MVLKEWNFLSKKSSAKRSFMTRKRIISMAMTLIEMRRVMKRCMDESKLLCNHQLLQFPPEPQWMVSLNELHGPFSKQPTPQYHSRTLNPLPIQPQSHNP
jgi:hypothetical protein